MDRFNRVFQKSTENTTSVLFSEMCRLYASKVLDKDVILAVGDNDNLSKLSIAEEKQLEILPSMDQFNRVFQKSTENTTSVLSSQELRSTFARFGLPEFIVTDNGTCMFHERGIQVVP